jgi:tRNA threonylcarbamoyl adenosine modification protein YeaZ
VDDALTLAIETSSLRGSVALGWGDEVLAGRVLSEEHKHAAELLPAVHELLSEAGRTPADVGVVCFSQGPGSFTGLRVAATVAQMWQSAVGSRVVAVPTLEVIARNGLAAEDAPRRLAVILDARRGKIFGAVFERTSRPSADPSLGGRGNGPSPDPSPEGRGTNGDLKAVAEAALHEVRAWLASLHRPCALLGDGLNQHRQLVLAMGLVALPEPLWWPDARQVLVIGRQRATVGLFCTPEQIVPAYLRPPECEEVYEQRRAEARARRQ